jgi:hypothetical protein
LASQIVTWSGDSEFKRGVTDFAAHEATVELVAQLGREIPLMLNMKRLSPHVDPVVDAVAQLMVQAAQIRADFISKPPLTAKILARTREALEQELTAGPTPTQRRAIETFLRIQVTPDSPIVRHRLPTRKDLDEDISVEDYNLAWEMWPRVWELARRLVSKADHVTQAIVEVMTGVKLTHHDRRVHRLDRNERRRR